ncbi:hypothetical protein GCK32_018366 [Trichostrongylus colubriformis]|uniref:TIL domain-containing protein n=1 Tax=Trichostrongylus colubriformis TaxID=6319 RepID=A0AAN8IFK4_TRICO
MLLLCVCQATDNDKRLLTVLVLQLVVSMNHSAGVVALFYFKVNVFGSGVQAREMQRTAFILMLIGIGNAFENAETKCPENEIYYDCMPVDNVCNLDLDHIEHPCVAGCFCKEGYKLKDFATETCLPVGPNCK